MSIRLFWTKTIYLTRWLAVINNYYFLFYIFAKKIINFWAFKLFIYICIWFRIPFTFFLNSNFNGFNVHFFNLKKRSKNHSSIKVVSPKMNLFLFTRNISYCLVQYWLSVFPGWRRRWIKEEAVNGVSNN